MEVGGGRGILPSMQEAQVQFPKPKKRKMFWEADGVGDFQPERYGLDPISASKNSVTGRSYLASLESFLTSKIGLIVI